MPPIVEYIVSKSTLSRRDVALCRFKADSCTYKRACVDPWRANADTREFRRIEGENSRRIGRALNLFNLQRRTSHEIRGIPLEIATRVDRVKRNRHFAKYQVVYRA